MGNAPAKKDQSSGCYIGTYYPCNNRNKDCSINGIFQKLVLKKIFEELYRIPGYAKNHALGRMFRLAPPTGHPDREILSQVVQNINEKAILDYAGRGVFFSLE